MPSHYPAALQLSVTAPAHETPLKRGHGIEGHSPRGRGIRRRLSKRSARRTKAAISRSLRSERSWSGDSSRAFRTAASSRPLSSEPAQPHNKVRSL
jgi:hypothetical protein